MARRVRAFSLESTVAAKSAGSGYPLGALRPGATIAADCSIATGTINNAMDTLFRIVAASQWEQALASGWVPRCAADERCNRIHLNECRDVERVAALWFSSQERPLALELDVTSVASSLRWEPRADEPLETWPNLHIGNIPLDIVVAVHVLVADGAGGFRC